ncbi:MAG: ABC transporter permease [Myxococcaceae bacterium]|nr:ABC transporter permease [Myxococcaceae bacterium]
MIKNLRELYRYRALLWSLTVRELRARYRASVLGFLWTFLNPTLQMTVYALVFGVVMKNSDPHYPYVIFTGLLPWIYFASSVVGGTTSISDRRDLLTKVRFPAQVLPATVVLTNLVNFVLSLPLLLGLGLLFDVTPSWHYVLVVPLVLLQTLFTLAVAYALSSLNVAFRDLQHIVANLIQLAFFGTPIVWDSAFAPLWYFYVNPMAALVRSYRDLFVAQQIPNPNPLIAVALVSLFLLFIGSTVFERRREEFAELV